MRRPPLLLCKKVFIAVQKCKVLGYNNIENRQNLKIEGQDYEELY